MKPMRLALIAILATLTLSGCASLEKAAPPWMKPAEAPPADEIQPAAPTPPARPKPAPPAKPAARPAPEASAAPVPVKLLGLSEAETRSLLGQPAEESAKPPGKVWIYRAGDCRLTVHLFPDMEKGGFYALDYTVEDGSREACLGKVAGEARKRR